jgi:2,3-bisphosphoglycerate-dependent phosphoglycerate mutase
LYQRSELKGKIKGKAMNTLVLLRHGQSQWNFENRFTGFHDIHLTDLGRSEASSAGKALKDLGIKFDHVFTSTLQRAYHTAEIALEQAGQKDLITRMVKDDALRERNYGDLTGSNRGETISKYGEPLVHTWRRSYDVKPPGGECLKDVLEGRVGPYFNSKIKPILNQGDNVLIVAHGNSLRALLISLEQETPQSIDQVEIATGVPIVFEMENGNITKRIMLGRHMPTSLQHRPT